MIHAFRKLAPPLRNFVSCAVCDKSFTSNWSKGRSKKYGFYRCNQKHCIWYGKSVRKEILEGKFESLLKDFVASENMIDVFKERFISRWEVRMEGVKRQIELIENKIKTIDQGVLSLSTRAAKASDAVALIYEKQIEELLEEKTSLEVSFIKLSKVTSLEGFETALDTVLGFIKSPYDTWIEKDLVYKKLLLKIVFSEPLTYTVNAGFETGNSPYIFRLFESFAGANSRGVEVGGIEPPSEAR